jgi:hypothetical protein
VVFRRQNSMKCLIWAVAVLLPLQALHVTKTLCSLQRRHSEAACGRDCTSLKRCCHKQREPSGNRILGACNRQSDQHGRLTKSGDDCSPFCWCKRKQTPQQLPTNYECRTTSVDHLTNGFVVNVDFRITLKKTCGNESKTASIESAQVRCALLSRFLI